MADIETTQDDAAEPLPERLKRPRTRTAAARGRNNSYACSNKWMHPFLKLYSETLDFTLACKAAEIDRKTVHERIKSDEGFAEAFEEAKQVAAYGLQAKAYKIAMQGDEKVFYDYEYAEDDTKYERPIKKAVKAITATNFQAIDRLLEVYCPTVFGKKIEVNADGSVSKAVKGIQDIIDELKSEPKLPIPETEPETMIQVYPAPRRLEDHS